MGKKERTLSNTRSDLKRRMKKLERKLRKYRLRRRYPSSSENEANLPVDDSVPDPQKDQYEWDSEEDLRAADGHIVSGPDAVSLLPGRERPRPPAPTPRSDTASPVGKKNPSQGVDSQSC